MVGIDTSDRIVGLGVSVPSVVIGTAAQVEAESTVSIMARHFSDVDALLLISFRLTMGGTPHIIEIHVDLGGDMIADVLLPAADATPDFFELALNIATGALGEVERMDCKPSALFYLRGPDMLSVAHAGGRCSIYRRPSVRQNLAVLPYLVNEEGLELSVWPRHLEWLDVNAPKGE